MTGKRSVQVGASGIIVEDGRVLLVKFDDENGQHYNFPGGGHQRGETLRQTAQREVKEEIDADVKVGRLLIVAESEPIVLGHVYGDVHYLKLFFECKLKPGSVPRLPEHPDPNEVAVEWVPLDEIANLPVIPDLSSVLPNALSNTEIQYFEDDGQVAKELNPK